MASRQPSSSSNRIISGLNYNTDLQYKGPNLKVVKSEIGPSGEAVHLVRPYAPVSQPSEKIVAQLANQYNYKTNQLNADREDLETFQKAFPKIAPALISSYDGSTIHSDNNQDLIGDRYLAEQIKRINEENKKKSILDKWSHLLYEGEDERTYTSATETPITDLTGLKPVNNATYSMNSNRGRNNFF